MNELSAISRALGHSVLSPQLFEAALTHRSFGTPHNERLEFLGDAVLSCAVADLLYLRFPELSEGELSRLRATLVRQDTLHQLALQIKVGTALRLGDGEEKSGGRARPSILADAVEALVGAVYLDAGFDAARAVVSRLYADMIGAIDPGRSAKDAKTRLQEILQAERRPLPRYSVRATTGDAHAQTFEVACEVADLRITTTGYGASRKIAEQRAAEQAIAAMGRS